MGCILYVVCNSVRCFCIRLITSIIITLEPYEIKTFVENRWWKGVSTKLKALHDWLSETSEKERPWLEKKIQNLRYSDRLDLLANQLAKEERERLSKHAKNVRDCGQYLEFVREPNARRLVLARAFFCKDRFCGLCQWRRLLKVTYQMTKTIEQSLIENPTSRFLFLTLTVKNVKGDEIRESILKMNEAFSRMMKWKRLKSLVIGFVRSTEITVNREQLTYHPHLHVLLQVKSSYFKGGNYISHDEWQEMWAKAMKLNYTPQVFVETIKPKRTGDDSVMSAIAEVGKYQVKPTTYLSTDKQLDVQIIKTLRDQMSHLRMVSYGLELKKIHKDLFDDKEIDDDLINVDDENKEKLAQAEKVVAMWNKGVHNYVIVEPKGKV